MPWKSVDVEAPEVRWERASERLAFPEDTYQSVQRSGGFLPSIEHME